MTIKNPPAFPSHAGDPEMSDPRNQISCGGMTLRDYFAGQALANCSLSYSPGEAEWVSKRCYEFADAMLAARMENSDG